MGNTRKLDNTATGAKPPLRHWHWVIVVSAAVLTVAAITNPNEKKHLRAAASYLSYNFIKHSDYWSGNSFSDDDREHLRATLKSDMLDRDAAMLIFVERRDFFFFSLTKMRGLGETIGAGAFGYVWMFVDMTDPQSAMNIVYNKYIEEQRRDAAGSRRLEAGAALPDIAYIDSLLSGTGVVRSASGGEGAGSADSGVVFSGEPRVSFTGPEILSGGRDRASIMRTVLDEIPALRHIYGRRLRDRPGLRGILTVRLSINDLGTVVSAEAVSSTMNDPVFEKTVLARVRSWGFDGFHATGDVTDVLYPFVFSRE